MLLNKQHVLMNDSTAFDNLFTVPEQPYNLFSPLVKAVSMVPATTWILLKQNNHMIWVTDYPFDRTLSLHNKLLGQSHPEITPKPMNCTVMMMLCYTRPDPLGAQRGLLNQLIRSHGQSQVLLGTLMLAIFPNHEDHRSWIASLPRHIRLN